MNRNENSFFDNILLERLRRLEKRIEKLEAKISKENIFSLEEDLKAQGLK
ncbi:hypothetical protein ACFL1R_07375 [Candidatus Latescibacterota bacterium]